MMTTKKHFLALAVLLLSATSIKAQSHAFGTRMIAHSLLYSFPVLSYKYYTQNNSNVEISALSYQSEGCFIPGYSKTRVFEFRYNHGLSRKYTSVYPYTSVMLSVARNRSGFDETYSTSYSSAIGAGLGVSVNLFGTGVRLSPELAYVSDLDLSVWNPNYVPTLLVGLHYTLK